MNATSADGDTRDTEYYEYHSSVQLEMQDLWISLLPIGQLVETPKSDLH
jgi:hypothetical protein